MITATYDAALSRVRLQVTGVNPGADVVHIERSTNQITWVTVRGGTSVAVVDAAANLDDYEFAADVLNYYRASAVDTAPITFVAAGTAATANNASVMPGLPAGIGGDRDTLYALASIRNSGAGTVNTPAGWTALASSGNVALLGRRVNTAGEGATLNANPNFETDATNWTGTGGTIARSTAQFHQGVASLLLTPDGVSGTAEAHAERPAVSVGSAYRCTAWVRCAVARTVVIGVNWHDGASGFLSDATATFPVLAGVWTLLDLTAIAPTSAATGELKVNITGTPPAGHLLYIDEARIRLAVAPPTISFAGGVAGADTIAQVCAFRNTGLALAASAVQLNGSAQDIGYPALTPAADGLAVIVAGWKQDDWTSVAALAGMAEIGETVATAGDDAGQVWDYVIQTAKAAITAGSFTVTGGTSQISRGLTAAVAPAPYLTQETTSVTPTLGGVWLKSIARPFLNLQVYVKAWSEVARPARAGVFDVAGRSLPVAVSDVRGSRRWTLDVLTQTSGEEADLDLLLASGDLLFVHVPPGRAVPGGYVTVGDTSQRFLKLSDLRVFTLPCTEVAAPASTVVGAVGTWQTVINGYATWADLIAAFATWDDVLNLVGSPADVIVP